MATIEDAYAGKVKDMAAPQYEQMPVRAGAAPGQVEQMPVRAGAAPGQVEQYSNVATSRPIPAARSAAGKMPGYGGAPAPRRDANYGYQDYPALPSPSQSAADDRAAAYESKSGTINKPSNSPGLFGGDYEDYGYIHKTPLELSQMSPEERAKFAKQQLDQHALNGDDEGTVEWFRRTGRRVRESYKDYDKAQAANRAKYAKRRAARDARIAKRRAANKATADAKVEDARSYHEWRNQPGRHGRGTRKEYDAEMNKQREAEAAAASGKPPDYRPYKGGENLGPVEHNQFLRWEAEVENIDSRIKGVENELNTVMSDRDLMSTEDGMKRMHELQNKRRGLNNRKYDAQAAIHSIETTGDIPPGMTYRPEGWEEAGRAARPPQPGDTPVPATQPSGGEGGGGGMGVPATQPSGGVAGPRPGGRGGTSAVAPPAAVGGGRRRGRPITGNEGSPALAPGEQITEDDIVEIISWLSDRFGVDYSEVNYRIGKSGEIEFNVPGRGVVDASGNIIEPEGK